MNKLYLVSFKDESKKGDYSATYAIVYAPSSEEAIRMTLAVDFWEDTKGDPATEYMLQTKEINPVDVGVLHCFYKAEKV